MTRWFVIFLAFLLHWSSAFADGAKVYIVSTANDAVGERFVYLLRENLRASHSMQLVLDPDEAFYRLHIVTLDPSSPENGASTVYSIVWTIKQLTSSAEIYWTTNVGICGRSAIADCANTIAAKTDEVVLDVQKTLLNLRKKRNK